MTCPLPLAPSITSKLSSGLNRKSFQKYVLPVRLIMPPMGVAPTEKSRLNKYTPKGDEEGGLASAITTPTRQLGENPKNPLKGTAWVGYALPSRMNWMVNGAPSEMGGV